MKFLKEAAQQMNNQYVQVEGNKVTFTVQDGTIPENGVNGMQAADMLFYLQLLFTALNKAAPCRENALTVTHIDEAYNWQTRRTADRMTRGVEGTEQP